MQVERKAEKGDKLCSSLHWIPGEMRCKNVSKVTCRKLGQVHDKTEWKRAQGAVYWIHVAKAKEQCVTLYQTKSHVIIAYKTVRRLSINDSLHQGQLQG